MSAITEADLATPPTGYSFHTHEWYPGVNQMWLYSDTIYGISVGLVPVQQLVHSFYNAFKRNSDGAIIINQAGLDAAAQAQDHINSLRIIPDAQFPDGGMTEHHSEFNATTNKFELKDLEPDTHAHHEQRHDRDIPLALEAVCMVRSFLTLHDVFLRTLTFEQKRTAQVGLNNFYTCMDDIIKSCAIPALENAWLRSVGKVTHPATAESHVEQAEAFASALWKHIDSRTKPQLGAARKHNYVLRLFDNLLSDRDKTADRFLPKGVVIVARKSKPAVATERTAAEVFTALKAQVAPVPRSPAPDA